MTFSHWSHRGYLAEAPQLNDAIAATAAIAIIETAQLQWRHWCYWWYGSYRSCATSMTLLMRPIQSYCNFVTKLCNCSDADAMIQRSCFALKYNQIHLAFGVIFATHYTPPLPIHLSHPSDGSVDDEIKTLTCTDYLFLFCNYHGHKYDYYQSGTIQKQTR